MLRSAKDLSLHPIDDFDLVSRWLELVGQKKDLARFIHPSCLKRQRLSRLNELRSRFEDDFAEPDLCDWLE